MSKVESLQYLDAKNKRMREYYLLDLRRKQQDFLDKLESLEKKRNNPFEGALNLVREYCWSEQRDDKDLESVLNDANTTLTILIRMLSKDDIPKSDILKKVEDLESLLSKAIQALTNINFEQSSLSELKKMERKIRPLHVDLERAYGDLYRHLYNAIIHQTSLIQEMEDDSSVEDEIKKAEKKLDSMKTDFRRVTGIDWKSVRDGGMTILSTHSAERLREEGPTLSSVDAVGKSDISTRIKEVINQLKADKALRDDARILYITGTHGGDRDSGLKWKFFLDHGIYEQDCETIGVLSGPKIQRCNLPMKTWDPKYPDILNHAVRLEPPPPDSFYADEEMKQLDFRLANMSYYHHQEKKLIEDINEFKPDLLILAFRYSMNGDISRLLRSTGITSEMVISHDLRILAENPRATLNYVQRTLLKEIVESSPMTSLFVWGSAGTGKTFMLTEALKIQLSKIMSQGRQVRVLATTFRRKSELLRIFFEKYLVDMNEIEVKDLYALCDELNLKWDGCNPCDTVNRVIRSLSDSSDDTVTLLLIDEVDPCGKDQKTPDWRHLVVRENVILLLGLKPHAIDASSTEVLPPENNSVLTRHLVHKHRNCPQIRNVIKTINSNT